jgi:hypothetical protein
VIFIESLELFFPESLELELVISQNQPAHSITTKLSDLTICRRTLYSIRYVAGLLQAHII